MKIWYYHLAKWQSCNKHQQQQQNYYPMQLGLSKQSKLPKLSPTDLLDHTLIESAHQAIKIETGLGHSETTQGTRPNGYINNW